MLQTPQVPQNADYPVGTPENPRVENKAIPLAYLMAGQKLMITIAEAEAAARGEKTA